MTPLPEWAQALIFCMPFIGIPGVMATVGLVMAKRKARKAK